MSKTRARPLVCAASLLDDRRWNQCFLGAAIRDKADNDERRVSREAPISCPLGAINERKEEGGMMMVGLAHPRS